jgi:hypothetical protein
MTWCDKLGSLPSVGVKLAPRLISSGAIIDALTSYATAYHKGDELRIQIERATPNVVVLNTMDGFEHGIEPTRAFITFKHQVQTKVSAGGMPRMETLSRLAPFSELLEEAMERMTKVIRALPGAGARPIARVGIVATTIAKLEEFPPGIVAMVEHMTAPWGGEYKDFSMNVNALLNDGEKGMESCLHTISRNVDEDDSLYTVRLDWQRQFKVEQASREDTLKRMLKDAAGSAIDYFEQLAEGERFIEEDGENR